MTFYKFAKNLVGIILKIIYRVRVYGRENMVEDGKLIICSNHTHNFDPVVVSVVYKRQVHWMAKKQLYENKVLARLWYALGAFPVDRDEADLSTIKNSLRILKEDKILGIFPEGTRVKELNLDNAKSGISLISIKAKSPIQPIYIESTYKLFSPINVYIGKPMEFTDLYGQKLSKDDYLIASKEILQEIYSIKEKEASK